MNYNFFKLFFVEFCLFVCQLSQNKLFKLFRLLETLIFQIIWNIHAQWKVMVGIVRLLKHRKAWELDVKGVSAWCSVFARHCSVCHTREEEFTQKRSRGKIWERRQKTALALSASPPPPSPPSPPPVVHSIWASVCGAESHWQAGPESSSEA